MCGIGGKFAFDGRIDDNVTEAMINAMPYRGPDDEGAVTSGPIGLAHCRLSIIDPSPAGHQPMANDDGSVYIVYNGEIYNYKELREEVANYQFTSETDTEVLLHLYEEYGIDCLSKLRGMFAFAIWDDGKQRLFLARDRLGQKPLFYRQTDDHFWFGSTVKTILADDDVSVEVDEDAIRSYLTYQYVPQPRTGFEGLRRLGPAEYMVVDSDGTTRDRYWTLSHTDQSDASPERLAEKLRDIFKESVRLRMRSDVPLGVFLSGGIDSTLVTGIMSEVAETSIKTYSVGFDEYDELDFARLVAEEYGTDHHEYMVTPDALDVLPELVQHFEMPFGDPSAVPTYYISQAAAEDITVAVGGAGGDEHFAGYDRYTFDKATTMASRIPRPVRAAGENLLAAIPETVPFAPHRRRARRLLSNANGDEVERYAPYICHMSNEEASWIWEGDVPDDDLAYLRAAFEAADGPTRLDRIMNVDVNTYLPDDILVKVDRAGMAHSLEIRSPFLDHELAEFAARVPAKYKWRRGTKKWLLKRAFEDYLPDPVRTRSKQGFSVPVNAWFRGELRDHAREQFEQLGQRSPFDASGLQTLLDRHVSETADHGFHIWDLVFLEQWYETFIDG